jgi:hypothetical protein
VAAILMDLSQAFDCLPHDILLSKLAAYGLSSQLVKLLENYLTGRKQQIKFQGRKIYQNSCHITILVES